MPTSPQPSLPAPSNRDLEIYKRCIVYRHDQCAIAMDHNLQQPRISQIINKVRRWLAAGGSPSDPAIRDHLAQQQLSAATQKLRLLRVIERATHAMEFQQPSQVTTRSRYHGVSEVWREEVRKQTPAVNMPAMRLLLRAVKSLDELQSRGPDLPADQSSPAISDDQLLASVFEFLCRWRSRAQSAGRFPPATNIAALVAERLNDLLGTALDPTGHITEIQPALPTITANTAPDISVPSQILIIPTATQPTTCSP